MQKSGGGTEKWVVPWEAGTWAVVCLVGRTEAYVLVADWPCYTLFRLARGGGVEPGEDCAKRVYRDQGHPIALADRFDGGMPPL